MPFPIERHSVPLCFTESYGIAYRSTGIGVLFKRNLHINIYDFKKSPQKKAFVNVQNTICFCSNSNRPHPIPKVSNILPSSLLYPLKQMTI